MKTKKKCFLFCIALGFHFVFDEDRMHLGYENKKKCFFVLHCARFSLSLKP